MISSFGRRHWFLPLQPCTHLTNLIPMHPVKHGCDFISGKPSSPSLHIYICMYVYNDLYIHVKICFEFFSLHRFVSSVCLLSLYRLFVCLLFNWFGMIHTYIYNPTHIVDFFWLFFLTLIFLKFKLVDFFFTNYKMIYKAEFFFVFKLRVYFFTSKEAVVSPLFLSCFTKKHFFLILFFVFSHKMKIYYGNM